MPFLLEPLHEILPHRFQDIFNRGLRGNKLICFVVVAIDSVDNRRIVIREINHVGIITNRIPAMKAGKSLRRTHRKE
jgi:hypothetical protein